MDRQAASGKRVRCHRGHRLTASYVVMRQYFLLIDASARSEMDCAAMARYAFGPKTIQVTHIDHGRTFFALIGDQFKLVLEEESILHKGWQLKYIDGSSIRHNGPHDNGNRIKSGNYISYLDPVGFGVSVVNMVLSTLSGMTGEFEVTIHVIGGLHRMEPTGILNNLRASPPELSPVVI